MGNSRTEEDGALHVVGLKNGVLGPVDLTVPPGSIVCLSGPSGAGKTLLLRAVADLDPHVGGVRLGNRQAEDLPGHEWRRRVGYLPAESQWWTERVGDHFPAMDADTLGTFGFQPDVMNWQVARLSTGERQRLAILRLLARQPRVLLLDEPTASLDPDNTLGAEALIRDYVRRQHAPVLWVSHALDQIERVADRHYRIEAGQLREADS